MAKVIKVKQPIVTKVKQPTATQSNAIANVAAQAAAAQKQVAASNGSAATTPVAKPILIKPTMQIKPIAATIATPTPAVRAIQEAVTAQLTSNGDTGLALKSAMTSAGGFDAGETTVTKGSEGSPERKGAPSEPEDEDDYKDNAEEANPNRKWWLIGGIGGGVLLIAIVVIIIVAMRKRK